jgi:hypothetical protein
MQNRRGHFAAIEHLNFAKTGAKAPDTLQSANPQNPTLLTPLCILQHRNPATPRIKGQTPLRKARIALCSAAYWQCAICGVKPPCVSGTGGLRPGGLRPGGLHPGGLHPGTLHPGGLHPGTLRPGGLHPGGLHPGGGRVARPARCALHSGGGSPRFTLVGAHFAKC